MVNKRRHHNAGGIALQMFHEEYTKRDWVVHIHYNSSFCGSIFVHNTWIWAQFVHLPAPHSLRSCVHRTLNNTETLLFGVCFAFLCITTKVECCMTYTKGNTTVLEAQQCTFLRLVMETSLFVYNAWLCLVLDNGADHLDSRSFA